MKEVELSPYEFALLRDFIHERFGIYFKEEKLGQLAFRLGPRLQALGLESHLDYLQHLKHDEDGAREAARMISLVTNNETYFFRELPQLLALRNSILPGLHRAKQAADDRTVRILCAGCSTGEEVYTVAILAYELGLFFWNWDFQVVGIDVDEAALARAREGIYPARSFRAADPERQRRFFTELPDGRFRVKDSVRKLTSFVSGNVLDPLTFQRRADVILCRNVLIYFSQEKMERALANFSAALPPGGWLLLGHSESVSSCGCDFEAVRHPGASICRKREALAHASAV